MAKDEPAKFSVYYDCSECGTHWNIYSDSTCNDRCPECDTETECSDYCDA